MAEKQPCRVSIQFSEKGRGVFILNGMDLTYNVSECTVQVIAGHKAIVTFKVFVDDLLAEGDASGMGLVHVAPPKD